MNKRVHYPNDTSEAVTKRPKRQFVLRQLQASDRRPTNDDIHSRIDLCPVFVALIGTAALFRLRNISQLGSASLVYINCNHKRFEHSLGVAHLAGKMVERIAERQPMLKITPKDKLCIRLGGLLHDVGHGPFSHLYEVFVTSRLPNYRKNHPELQEFYQNVPDLPEGWKHEHVSLSMIDLALEQLGLQIDPTRLDEPLKQIGDGVDARSMRVFEPGTSSSSDEDILTSRDWIFIKECILGGPLPELEEKYGLQGLIGRTEETKEWLYDIVSNRHSGLDVDKIDYFARDQRSAFRFSGEIAVTMIDEAVVTWAQCTRAAGKCPRCSAAGNRKGQRQGKHLMICYPEKMVRSCISFFKLRHELHSTIYKHKTVESAGYLICDILCLADPFFRLSVASNSGRPKSEHDSLPMSRAMLDTHAFLELDESIFGVIKVAARTDPRLNKAVDLIRKRYSTRDLYKCAISQPVNMTNPLEQQVWNMGPEKIEHALLEFSKKYGCVHDDDSSGKEISVARGDFIVHRSSANYGQRDKNPLTKMRFVTKEKLEQLRVCPINQLPEASEADESAYETYLPRHFQSCTIRIFARDTSKKALIGHLFSAWFSAIKDEMEETPSMTPQPPALLSQEDGDTAQDNMYYGEEQQPFFDPLGSPVAVQGNKETTPKITPPRRRL